MPTSRLSLLTLAAAFAGIAYAAPAIAQPTQTVSAEIQYDNSALHSRAGAAAVLDSLQDQAIAVCRYDVPVSQAPRTDASCVSRVVAQAVNKINHPKLTEAYVSRSGLATQRMVAAK
ncbi:MAG: UrcA family protein [Hyphomonas sp.]|nr:UrcA family protein [Hyphomonas sp.]